MGGPAQNGKTNNLKHMILELLGAKKDILQNHNKPNKFLTP